MSLTNSDWTRKISAVGGKKFMVAEVCVYI